MKVAIMQPYFFPYIGYFQLINAVDKFVVYDNIQFTKKGWINRNRILVNGNDEYITLPLKKDSDFLNIYQRSLAASFNEDKKKLLRKIEIIYKKAPEFKNVFPLIEKVLLYHEENLFQFIYHSIITVCDFLHINTEIIISSAIPVDHSLKSQEKVLVICKVLGATTYINPAGGVALYSKPVFEESNISLQFLQSATIEYTQFGNTFIPRLSIIDVLMFNDKEKTKEYLNTFYTLS